MQAIILAAGLGRRLGKLTGDRTKCMIEVNGVTLIERMLTQLSKLNLTKVVIVIGYEGDKVKSLVSDNFKGTPIVYVNNPIYDKTNNIYSLFLAKDYLLNEDTLLLEADLILDQSILNKVIKNEYPNLAVVDKYQSWMDGTVVKIDKASNIKSFVPKKNFQYNEINDYYKTVNVYKFSKGFSNTHYVPFLEAYSKALGNNEYYEQVLRVITLLETSNIKAMPLDGEYWYEIDDIQDLDNAETIFANDEDLLDKVQKRYGGYWRYPKLIDFCYLVNPYFPPKKLIEEIKASFATLLTQYPSGLDVNSLLCAKYFNIDPEYVVVGNGAAEIINAYLVDNNLITGIILPTFEEYVNRIPNSENKIYFLPEGEDFRYTSDDLINFYNEHPIEQLILINPDNPSGNFIPLDGLMKLLKWGKEKNIRLIVDESFVDFSDEGHENTLLDNDILETYHNLIVIKSISKSYGVPGLRLGIGATGNQEVLKEIKLKISIWNINSFAEFYLQIFNKYESNYNEACKLFIEESNTFYKELQTISYLKVFPSKANFFLCKVLKGNSTKLTEQILKNHRLIIKDCSTKLGFDGASYIRIAIRNREDNARLINALKIMDK